MRFTEPYQHASDLANSGPNDLLEAERLMFMELSQSEGYFRREIPDRLNTAT